QIERRRTQRNTVCTQAAHNPQTATPPSRGLTIAVAVLALVFGCAPVLALRAGDLDPTFGTGGTVTTPLDGYGSGVNAAVVQSDGKLVAAGSASLPQDGEGTFAVVRYNPDGSIDPSFGTDGTVTAPRGLWNALVLQPDGKLVAGGE